MGMVASHLGIVRAYSRKGEKVWYIDVSYDMKVLENIVNHSKSLPGIIDVIVEINEGRLNIGDTLMLVAVGGDIRENVFPALIQTVDRVKKEAAQKKEVLENNGIEERNVTWE
jgi:molybdopterin synthase catalytic subunit